MDDIKDVSSPLEFAYKLYQSLNTKVVFSTKYIAAGRDLTNRIAKEEYNKSVNQLSEQDNEITCKTWAETYAYLLIKNGWIAIVVGRKHKYVIALKDKYFIAADATNEIEKMTDLIRAKLGEAQICFQDCTGNFLEEVEKIKSESQKYVPPAMIEFNPIMQNSIDKNEIRELLGLIGDTEDLTFELFNIDKSSVNLSVLKKMQWINDLLKECTLEDQSEYVLYLRHLFFIAFHYPENKVCKLSFDSLYRDMDTHIEMFPIVSIYLGDSNNTPSKRNVEEYRFLIFKKGEHTLTTVSREELLNMIGVEVAKVDIYDEIEGLPELTGKVIYGNLKNYFVDESDLKNTEGRTQ